MNKEHFVILVIAITFVAPIVGHTINTATNSSENILETEKRVVTNAPNLPTNAVELNRYFKKLNIWMGDNFGLRTQLLNSNRILSDKLDIRATDNPILLGRNGWLFLNKTQSLKVYQGLEEISPIAVTAWLEKALELNDHFKRRDTNFGVLISPDKLSIYPEFLPSFVRKAPRPTFLSELDVNARKTDLKFINPANALFAAKDQHQLYFSTDTHWNGYGAYIAYASVVASLDPSQIRIKMIHPSRLVEQKDFEKSGDLIAIGGLQGKQSEVTPTLFILDPVKFQTKRVEESSFNETVTTIYMTDATDRPTILVIGDSFSVGLLPFLRESFSKVIFTHHREGNFDLAFIDSFETDFVLLQMVERSLYQELTPAGL